MPIDAIIIAAGNAMGMPTVQLLRPGVVRGTTAVYYLADLYALRRLIRS